MMHVYPSSKHDAEVAKARSTLGDATFLIEAFSGQHYTQARDYLRLLFVDHARLAEDVVKLRRVAEAETHTYRHDGVDKPMGRCGMCR